MLEIWKPVKNYEEYYEVSNLGRLKRLERLQTYSDGHTQILKERISNGVIVKDGYLQVSLTINGKTTRKYIHRLVAEAFISNPNNLDTVNHKDHNKLNNCVDNLEWLSNIDNIHDMLDFHNIDWRLQKNCKCCGKKIWKKSTTDLCLVCYNKNYRYNKDYGEEYVTSNKGITVNRDILKNQIRTQSFSSLGKFYGVTDNAVRKWCKNFNLPYKSTEIKKYTDEEWVLI